MNKEPKPDSMMERLANRVRREAYLAQKAGSLLSAENMVRAILQELREPSEEMHSIWSQGHTENGHMVVRAMIDAILEGRA
jgi:hypothetical protein